MSLQQPVRRSAPMLAAEPFIACRWLRNSPTLRDASDASILAIRVTLSATNTPISLSMNAGEEPSSSRSASVSALTTGAGPCLSGGDGRRLSSATGFEASCGLPAHRD